MDGLRRFAVPLVVLVAAGCGGGDPSIESQVEDRLRADHPYVRVIECADPDGDGDEDDCLVENEETGGRSRVPIVVYEGELVAVFSSFVDD